MNLLTIILCGPLSIGLALMSLFTAIYFYDNRNAETFGFLILFCGLSVGFGAITGNAVLNF